MGIGTKHLSKKSREQQIVIAADTVLQQVGVNNFTIDQVVETLDIAKGTVYKYYKSKDELLSMVSIKALRLLLDYFKLTVNGKEGGAESIKAMLMSCYQYAQSYPEYFELIVYMERPEFHSQMDAYASISAEITDFVKTHISKEQQLGTINKELKPLTVTYVLWGSCMGMMNFIESKRNFIKNVDDIDQRELIATYAGLLASGMEA
ncbi:MAG: TetR/AcrR family transcriptional regulator [Croceivirga sp.]